MSGVRLLWKATSTKFPDKESTHGRCYDFFCCFFDTYDMVLLSFHSDFFWRRRRQATGSLRATLAMDGSPNLLLRITTNHQTKPFHLIHVSTTHQPVNNLPLPGKVIRSELSITPPPPPLPQKQVCHTHTI